MSGSSPGEDPGDRAPRQAGQKRHRALWLWLSRAGGSRTATNSTAARGGGLAQPTTGEDGWGGHGVLEKGHLVRTWPLKASGPCYSKRGTRTRPWGAC